MRKKAQDKQEDFVKEFAGKAAAQADELSRIACPRCGNRTLGLETDARCGVRVVCSGYSGVESTDYRGECQYFYVEQLTVDKDLPEVHNVPKKEEPLKPVEGKENA